MGRILEEGINAMRQGEARRQFIAGAAARFEALGTPEAVQMAQMIRQNPEGATQYMQQFGGWNSVYDLTRADAARTALTSALGQLGGASTQQEVLQRLLPVALQFGLDGSLVKMVGEAYAPQGPPSWVAQIDPDLYDNFGEFISTGQQTGDWAGASALLHSRKSGGDDIIGGKYLAVRDEQGRIVAAKPIPGVRFGEEEGGGSQKPPSGYRWRADGGLEPIPGGPAELGGRVADILARDARGEPISEGDAALVNNYSKQFPDPLGLQRPVFKPRSVAAQPSAAPSRPAPVAGGAFDDLVPPIPETPKPSKRAEPPTKQRPSPRGIRYDKR